LNPEAASPETLIFEAELSPHRSLSARGIGIVLGFLGIVSLGVTTLFWWLGAGLRPAAAGRGRCCCSPPAACAC
jgi:uncharacterized membrane protein